MENSIYIDLCPYTKGNVLISFLNDAGVATDERVVSLDWLKAQVAQCESVAEDWANDEQADNEHEWEHEAAERGLNYDIDSLTDDFLGY